MEQHQKRTKDYRIVIAVGNVANVAEYTQTVDLKCIDTEQNIFNKASMHVESCNWSYADAIHTNLYCIEYASNKNS